MGSLKFKIKSYIRPFVVKLIKKLLLKYVPSVLIEPTSSRVKNLNANEKKSTISVVYSLVVHAIRTSKEPVDTVNYMYNSLELSERDLWFALMDLKGMACQNFKTISDLANQVESKDIRLRLILDNALSTNAILSSDEIDGLIHQYQKVLNDLKSKQSIRSMLVTLVLLKVPLPYISEKLKKISFDPASLTESQKIKFMSRIKSEDNKDQFKVWESRLRIDSDQANVKLKQIKGELFGGGNEVFKEIEKDFVDLNFNISNIYKNELKPVFDLITDRENLIWIQYDSGAVKKFKNLLIERVREKKPTCYIRIGDGESYAFPDGLHVDKEGVLRQERHWWGREISDRDREKIQGQFLTALSSADILGVPTITRLVKDFNLEKKDSYTINSGISRNICVMKAMSDFLSHKTIVDCQSNLFLFDREFCISLFKVAEKVCVVSGVNESLVEKWAPDVSKLECIEVPTHRLLLDDVAGASVGGILPEVYEVYLEKIAQLAAPGVIFLVSAGFVGKIFISEAARGGGVGLDMGQSLVSAVRNHGAYL